jgi:hypothetical protein
MTVLHQSFDVFAFEFGILVNKVHELVVFELDFS